MTRIISITDHQRQLQRRVRRNWQATHTLSQLVDQIWKRSEQLLQELQRLKDANPGMTEMNVQQITISWALVVSLFAVYVIDCVLFGPVAEFFADRNFAGSPTMMIVSRLILPIAILLLELYFSIQSYLAQEAKLDGWDDSSTGRFWTFVASIFAVAMPAAVVATFLASEAAFSSWVSGVLLMMLVALSLGGHLAVLFGRKELLDALSFAVFRWRTARLERKLRRLDNHSRQCAQAIARRFQEYVNDVQLYNARYSEFDVQPQQPCDAVTQKILALVFGQERLQALTVSLRSNWNIARLEESPVRTSLESTVR